YPSITLSATSGFQSLDIAEFIDPNSIFTTLIGGLTQPVFNRRQIKTQYEVAKAEEQQAYLNFEKTLINAAKEVTDALYNYQNANDRFAVKQEEYQAYQQAVDDAQLLLESGSINYLEVLNARENALNTKLELVNTRLQEVNAQVELYRSLGGGWK
ncbi:MAG: TolC family protein, partial [Psychroflexus sp.]|nr:TolC family protein [Psychroflexus sp.]